MNDNTPSPRGSCTLVGAGPGDPELLTIKAVKAIRAATVLLVDDLVHDDVLAWARPDARIVHVGKRGGCKSTPQAFIEKLMIAAVREGEQVVRLKGGDPFIFGRGGEEVEHLRAAGIDCQVVNGITAGLAAVTALGVPLTHRDHAHGVVFMTGHAKPGHQPTDWPLVGASVRTLGLTLVVYMGIGRVADLQQGLLQSLPATTPVAVVKNASLAHQQHCVTTLAALQHAIVRNELGSPAVIVVGDVVRGVQCLSSASSSPLEEIAQKKALNMR
ncbi:uroporphyrinogen-III C-methyltransferase [Pseudorhodoferax sp.]|uniref:uroporphyrinogen-III C-methyltransferase n=1 Tax=Pseudorhodoferax sp. TaxID=1993553 RepID=UPI0039E5AE8B